jgi:KaiC/GvpD/RAD55 family RecA-like ATPase
LKAEGDLPMSGSYQSLTSFVKIEGLDEAFQARLHPGQNILLLGSPSTGKSTFALQFIASGLRADERAIVITTSDSPANIRNKASTFGWKLEDFEKNGKLHFIDCFSEVVGIPADNSGAVLRTGIDSHGFDKISLLVSAIISDFWAEGHKIRVVFDNLSTLFYYNDLVSVARFLHVLLGRLKAVDATSILVLESGVHDEQVTTVVRSLCDGVLQLTDKGNKRYIQGILGAGSLRRAAIELSKTGLRVAVAPTPRTT